MSLLVAAIDFGTTFSGYAFSLLHEYKKDPLKILANTWTSGVGSLVSLKTSTCVLFDSTGKFHSFGYEAEEKYSNLALDDEHHDWYFFRRFKMMLFSKTVCTNINKILTGTITLINYKVFYHNFYIIGKLDDS